MSSGDQPTTLAAVVRALRPRQWIKNVLVFAAPVAAGVMFESPTFGRAVGAFACFCAVASATYLVNDVLDVEADRRHPTKRHRPIAAGHLSEPLALVLAVVLFVAGVGGSVFVEWHFTIVLLAYLGVTTAYSLWLKHVPILDLVAVAAGFVLRALGGAAATDVLISAWFFIVTSFGALFMVAGKRHGEKSDLADEAIDVRPTLGAYTPAFLAYLRAVFSGGVLVAYCLWAFASATTKPAGAVWFQISIVPFAVAVLRYALLLDQGKGAEPETLVLSDHTLLISAAVWALVYGGAVYVT